MKILIYIVAILFLVISLLILPDPPKVVHYLLALGGSGFFASKLISEFRSKK